ncbi:isoleucine--tRNA ligase [Hyalangium minutum]|uniref:isoleucine--tRNA ligase n=1 Tax=Hyalangium minutum TaxID=394096 RepID=A0A085WKD8_9BACT|nr:class I tRNA ligase family protein [Hyalangium minutum]KFE68151.1 Isoleucyl-tRNA synthetase [Hyalangium minutum]
MSDVGAPPKDYRGTLNLPRTELPPQGEPERVEPRMLARWSELSLGARMREQRTGAEPFVLAARPLEARRPLHMGQALSVVLQDIVRKYRHLSGRRCDFLFGWDTHGMPSEDDFLQQKEAVLHRLGGLGSEAKPYRTQDPAYAARELRELATLARRGLLSRRKQPLLWCPEEQKVLGEHEVEEASRLSPSVYVAFRAGPEVAERFSSLKGREVFFVTWTLAPWSLPGNVALSVNADFEYVFYEAGQRVLCVAKDLLAKVLAEVKADELVMKNARLPGGDVETVAFDDLRKILVYASGEDLAGLRYQHPFLERTGQVVLGGPSTLEQGTGLVHVAPGLGQGDAEVDPKLGLELYNPVGQNGRYDETVGTPLQGMRVLAADSVILELLAERGALLNAKKDTVEHSLPHCRSCHQPVIRAASAQWFIALDSPLPGGKTLRERAMEEADRVQWRPDSGRGALRDVLEKRADGCISRKESWGVPLPIAYCEGCGEAVVSPELMERVAATVEKADASVWHRTPVEEFLGADFRCASCGGSRFRRETDTLDPQFDAACMFSAVLGPRQGLPADLCLTEREQLDGWLASAMVVSVGTRDASPYRTCFTHGSGVDAHGQKLSRSQERDADAKTFVVRYGAEVLRLWAAFSDLQNDVPLSDAIREALIQDLAKLRHTLAFALGHLSGFEPARDSVPASQLLPLDAWARGRLSEMVARVREAYEAHALHRVHSDVMDFCAAELSATYFAIIEDRLLTASASGRERRSAQTVLFEVASSLLRLLAPILSFTAEEAWQQLPGRSAESVFLTDLPQPVGPMDPELAERYARLLAMRSAVRVLIEETLREERLGSSLNARVVLAAAGEAKAFLLAHIEELPALFRVSQVELVDEPGPKARPLALAQAWNGAELAAEVLPAWGAKCPRCGGFAEEVEQESEVCPRCSEALS